MTTETCPRKIWDSGGWHSYPCGRAIKENGLCGIHNGADKRSAAADKKRNQIYEERKVIRSRLKDMTARLGAGRITYDDEIILTEQELLGVIDRLGL